METVEQLIRSESNPEILRELSLFILQQSKIISAENDEFRKAIAKRESERQEWLNSSVQVQLTKLRRRFFESGRECLGLKKRDRRTEEEQLLLHAQSLVGKKSKEEKDTLPVIEKAHEASSEQIVILAAEKDAELTPELAEIEPIVGLFETASEITVTERIYKKVTNKRQKYRVKNKATGKETIVAAPGPLKLLPGCRYSVDFAISVVSAKFLNHMPYERQRRDMKRAGLTVPVMTLFRLSEMVALHMEDVVGLIRRDILRPSNWRCILMKRDGPFYLAMMPTGRCGFYPTRRGRIIDLSQPALAVLLMSY